MLIKGEKVDLWVCNMIDSLRRLHPVHHNVLTVWEEFKQAFKDKFVDLTCELRARNQLQCWTAKVHQFSSMGNRFFMGKRTPGSFSEGLKTSKNTLFLLFPRFFGLDILWTLNLTI
jgi:hypothetical protein